MTPEEWTRVLEAAHRDRRDAALYGVIVGVSAMAMVAIVALAALGVLK